MYNAECYDGPPFSDRVEDCQDSNLTRDKVNVRNGVKSRGDGELRFICIQYK